MSLAKDPQKELANACQTCPAHNASHMQSMGIDMENSDYIIALAGNPNTGKSTVFNSLTGLRQHTGNWPGKTVGRAEGGFSFGDHRYKLVDLPGTYSLLSTSYDEEIARDFILFGRPDVTLIVVDGTRLERNLNLTLQVLEITDRVVICLNLMDEVSRHGMKIDDRRLARDLGVPVVPTAARQRQGLDKLLQAIDDVATGRTVCRPHRIRSESVAIKNAVSQITEMVESLYPNMPNARWVALRLLDGDQQIANAFRRGDFSSYGQQSDDKATGDLDFELRAA